MNPRPRPNWFLFLSVIVFLTATSLSAGPPECPDGDGDGWVVCDGQCAPGPGDQCGDCDDGNANRFPGNAEICDGLDNDCNGPADETFTNLGEACTAGLGICEATGVIACTDRGIGNIRVKDIRPGPEGSEPEYLTNVDGIVFFYADDGTHGRELWKSDGTEQGTVLVKDINPGPDESFPGYPLDHLRNVDGTLFFYADDGVNGAELWKSDGTEAGTVMVKDINPGPDGSRHAPVEHGGGAFVVYNGALFFWADDGVIGSELWTSDGTESGTVLVKDINPIPTGSVWPEFITRIIDGVLYFGATSQSSSFLWRTDGTTGGTEMVTNSVSLTDSDQWANLDGTLIFGGFDVPVGAEPWKSDGAAQGTTLIKNIDPGPSSAGSLLTAEFVELNDTVFFAAIWPGYCPALWKTDGTEQGTVLVSDNHPGPGCGLWPDHLAAALGAVFFQAYQPDTGVELWKSDGTSQGTVLLKDISPGPDSSYPGRVTEVNGAMFFAGPGGLWRTDGTEQGTVLVGPSVGASFINVDGTLFSRGSDAESGGELWISDGTVDGTRCDAVVGTATAELCGDLVDNDCDGSIDEGDALVALPWYMDTDGDTFGDPERPTTSCGPLAGFVADATDCDDTDDQVWALPREVLGLRFAGDKVSLGWDPPSNLGGTSVVYDTIRSDNPADFSSIATCVEEDDGSDTSSIDAEVPLAGAAYHYLVGAENACGRGSVGLDPTGAERDASACP